MTSLLAELDLLDASINRCCDVARANGDVALFHELRRMHWACCDLIARLEVRKAEAKGSAT